MKDLDSVEREREEKDLTSTCTYSFIHTSKMENKMPMTHLSYSQTPQMKSYPDATTTLAFYQTEILLHPIIQVRNYNTSTSILINIK